MNSYLYQIYYDEKSKKILDPNFLPLDNSANTHDGWMEYTAIRNVLLNKKFKNGDYIGFFSPRLKGKTGLAYCDIIKCIETKPGYIYSFSPAFQSSVLFKNSFLQGDHWHPGLLNLSSIYSKKVSLNIDLDNLVQDDARIIFSNYYVAKYELWREWFNYSEQLYKLSESSKDLKLIHKFSYHAGHYNYTLKPFLMERMISLVLEKNKINASIEFDPILQPRDFKIETLITLNGFKTQYIKTNNIKYLDLYQDLAKKVKHPIWKNLYKDSN